MTQPYIMLHSTYPFFSCIASHAFRRRAFRVSRYFHEVEARPRPGRRPVVAEAEVMRDAGSNELIKVASRLSSFTY